MSSLYIDKKLLQKLGDEIANGHSRFGKIAPRKPYHDDDDRDGGSAALLFETHPLLKDQPIGAASDLTYIAWANSNSIDNLEARQDEAVPELRYRCDQVLGKQYAAAPKPAPSIVG